MVEGDEMDEMDEMDEIGDTGAPAKDGAPRPYCVAPAKV
jgi:hypothetical protein